MVDLLYYLLFLIVAFILLVFVIYTIYVAIVHSRFAHIPQPKGANFYLGHLPLMYKEMQKGRFIFDIITEWQQTNGTIIVWWRLHIPALIISDPEAIKKLSGTDVPKSTYFPLRKLWNKQRFMENGLVLIETYDEWKVRRRTYDPSFGKNYLQSLVPRFNEVAQQVFIKDLKQCVDTVVDMKHKFSLITLYIISGVAFGADFSKPSYLHSQLLNPNLLSLLDTALDGAQKEILNKYISYFKPFSGTPYINAVIKLREIGRQCIEERTDAIKNNKEVPHDILTNIISLTQKEGNMTLEDLVDDFVTFYIAGQETTSNMLSFSLILLLQHPEILERVLAEIDEVLGDKETLSFEDLEQMTYTAAVFEESLRLYPTTPIIGKTFKKDTLLCDYNVPKNTELFVINYGLHRNPEYFDDPLKFDPSRFEPGQKRPSPYAYIPFGIGHRSCIGRIFAMMEAKVIMALLLHEFTLSLPDDYQLKLVHHITMKPAEVPCTLKLRKK